MRFFHLADLHLGKKLGNISLIQDQKYLLRQILTLTEEMRPQALLIAGDIYDKPTPSVEAVELFDDFLTALSALGLPVLLISGNHDSPERLDYGGRIMAKSHIHVAGAFTGEMPEITLNDEQGPVIFRLLPFIRPAQVRRFFPDEELTTYDAACRRVLEAQPLPAGTRCVLLAHQFITAGGQRPQGDESEQLSVGGLDNIDASAFAGYAYVALGHIHRAQSIGNERIRYAGSPLKYSFSEYQHHKSLTAVELDGAGEINVRLVELPPLRDMRHIRGPLEKLVDPQVVEAANKEDYLYVTLTDEEDLTDPLDALRRIYPNVLKLDFANSRSGPSAAQIAAPDPEKTDPAELFRDFYRLQQNIEPDEEKMAIVTRIFRGLAGDE